ncbi:methylcobamide:CoM methyltransferase MtbA [Acetivibrio mesophilus]|uniref:MtaA/CmuA family methyltransferase n=1 Tax=Acetivibrio mesophilus TaxID=2487273 RepID=A0A4Q0I308_9FIRM|nr:methylcobamide:CoM methyltransferase MtbA [Acetivibrio mesophilus]ODM27692.1 methylcobamide--CoM methyltransferase [Clostridium sp. Bc-iso-3]RXE58634.1 MtaA/CmuA family methyltransferase [Acetivibrio mesophilus]HHV30734.1 MtaA/CmuA family methyltransferase [Clostridium sp.]
MSIISPKERILRVLNKEKVDRPPVICPGGMMNAAIVDVMKSTGHTLPEAHHDDKLMAELAKDIFKYTGFENFGIPFCMTVEAEVLGSEINFGTLACEPKIEKEVFDSVSDVVYQDIGKILKKGRIESVIQAGYLLSKRNKDVPVVGNLTGPLSTSASIVNPISFLKELRKDRENAHRVINYVTDFLIEYAKLMIDNGVDLISIGDPTATGEILGPKMFEEYALRYLNKLIDGIHSFKVPVIVHICGNINTVKRFIPYIKSDAISTDAIINLRILKDEFPSLTTMGNLSTFLLQFGNPEKVADQTERLLRDGIDIISPACGLSTSSSIHNIRALTTTVKEHSSYGRSNILPAKQIH